VAKSAQAEPAAPPAAAAGYLAWSRDPAVGLLAVLPIWIAYTLLRALLTPAERNGAEAMVMDALHLFGPRALLVLQLLFLATVLAAAWSVHRRQLPWLRVAGVSALEGTVYGLMLGPLAGGLAASTMLAVGQQDSRLAADLVGALGAGLFEEAVFRLVLLSLLGVALGRAARAFALPALAGVLAAIVLSALLFALFHHLGPGGQPYSAPVFLFRSAAGLLLGALFVLRGLGVCVYTHAMYDVHFYLTH
jgi:membrane protease YdiL (CAAX protease family)